MTGVKSKIRSDVIGRKPTTSEIRDQVLAERIQADEKAGIRAVKRLEAGAARVSKYSKVPDRLANSDIWFRNERIPYAKEFFSEDEWRMHFAQLFYPYAEGGPLFIDFPQAPYEEKWCEKKLEAYRSKGVRYTYILSNEGFNEALARLESTQLKTKKVEKEEASA